MRRLALALLVVSCATEEVFVHTSPTWERMIVQMKVDPYEPGSLRHPPHGTVPFGASEASPTVPPVNWHVLQRGKDRYERFCRPCHGVLGYGDGPVAENMQLVKPANLQMDRLRIAPDLRLYQVIRDGYGLMPGYAAELAPVDAWAVIAYVRALQLSQNADLHALPPAWQELAVRELAGQGGGGP